MTNIQIFTKILNSRFRDFLKKLRGCVKKPQKISLINEKNKISQYEPTF